MKISIQHVEKAYLYLKSLAYHENLNLFLKQRIAKFEEDNIKLSQLMECEEESKNGLDDVFEKIALIINSDVYSDSKQFSRWLDRISYHLLPKAVEREEDSRHREHKENQGLFISNVRESDKYFVSKLNYFISAPVELHIIETIWCLFVGSVLETKMNKCSYGNRMHPFVLKNAMNKNSSNGTELFKRYINQYNKWRDQAIDVANNISKNGEDVAVLSLDIKSFYYNVDVDFKEIKQIIEDHYKEDTDKCQLALRLNYLLEQIFVKYQKSISSSFKQTHTDCEDNLLLPIGLSSSSIIANWYLSEFDDLIESDIRPDYYGRYVDDIIMVFKQPENVDFRSNGSPIESFIEHYLGITLTINENKKSNYTINVHNQSFEIQKDKLILHFLDKNHSRASLEVFKKKLDEQSSAFKFLPSDHINKELEEFAYDIIYNGSTNKLRNMVGLVENETELAKYLSSHIIAHRLCRTNESDTVLSQVKHFFKGQNALQYFRLWEKIYQYAVITRSNKFVIFFYNYINSEINKITYLKSKRKYKLKGVTEYLQEDLKLFNNLSLAMTMGLLDNTANERILRKINSFEVQIEELKKHSRSFRSSNLIRHNLVAWPLANYSKSGNESNHDLTIETSFISNKDIELDNNKLRYSPRFIHLDEWQLFNLNKLLSAGKNLNDLLEDVLIEYKDKFQQSIEPIEFTSAVNEESKIVKSHLEVEGNESKQKLILAIANIKLNAANIQDAIRKDRGPNISFERQETLYRVLNSAISENADMVVLPEVAIPVSWLPFMITFSRRNQIGLIFGLEHWIVDNTAFNLIIEVLPFRTSDKYKSCVMTARIKNHYAPAELEMLQTFRLQPANKYLKPKSYYHKISWRGTCFTTYNCFELSDITHRSLFKSEIDLLVACVWNKDTNYYGHILESVVRDIHCYTLQVNTSQYGGSCILQPTKTVNSNIIYVKGGENSCILTTTLNIKKLRDFQFKSKPGKSDYFKHLPPGYNHDSVLDR
ncbi:hypothetical protein DLE54_05570 [Psychrobacter sp. YP14]|uniref:RNA-directed DNA polymerase n=1 Tax=Psychrobacter sp. YP14 TaxID=2203895 RepID=UPI000D7DBA1B|nr:RNA-directed DNA polymerase [Psychrobacter sp. YP14]AWT49049.1 hypothetical protein DLE54_05570 [Psychrobacter sp. YP14]